MADRPYLAVGWFPVQGLRGLGCLRGLASGGLFRGNRSCGLEDFEFLKRVMYFALGSLRWSRSVGME